MRLSDGRIAALIAAVATIGLLWIHGNRMVLTNDEGIILDAAQRMVRGEQPYVDFFGYMSPGSYWLQALVFKLLGVAHWTGRLLVILDFAIQCGLVFWLTARLAGRRAASVAAFCLAGFQIADPAFLTSTHRWDSATLALTALCLVVRAAGDAAPPAASSGGGHRAGTWRWFAAGALLAAAAWCTPSMALAGIVVAAWVFFQPAPRNALAPLGAGLASIAGLGLAELLFTGTLGGFVAQMQWLSRNYSSVNVMGYGSVIGGYGALFTETTGAVDMAIRVVLVGCIALPAILPPLAALLFGGLWWRGKLEPGQRPVAMLLLASAAAMVATVFPRADVMHLTWVAALPVVLTTAGLARTLAGRAAGYLSVAMMLLATVFSLNYFLGLPKTQRLETPAGVLRVPSSLARATAGILAHTRPGDSLFVYPYLPMQYLITQARNPTRYSYLNPGMMKLPEEREALDQLQHDPPRWVLYLQLTDQEFSRVFPHDDSLDWRFHEIDAWLEANYRPLPDPGLNLAGYRLWERSDAGPEPQHTAAAKHVAGSAATQ